MVVAMIPMRVVQASIDQIINMVPMGNRVMAAARAVPMRLIMSGSAMLWVAPVGIGGANFNHVFISTPAFNMLQMSLIEKIHVPFMLNGDMPAPRTVHVRLIGGGHGLSFLLLGVLCKA